MVGKGSMENRKKRVHALAAGLMASLLTVAAGAQQSGTAAKPAATGSSPSPVAGTTGNGAAAASPGDAVVMKVGASQLTQSEIESLFSLRASAGRQKLNAEARRHLAESYVRIFVLSQQAMNDHLDTSPALRFRIEMQRATMLAQAEYDKMRNQIQVSPEEVAQYYNDHPLEFDTIQVREFLVRKRQPGTEDAGSSGLSAEDAKARAESIRKELASGSSPDEVSQDFSGTDVLLIDPKPRTLHRNEMIPALEKAAFQARDGEVPEAVDTPEAVIVLDVLKRAHIEQKDAAAEIEKKLRAHKLEAQIEDLKKKASIWIDDAYLKNDAMAAPALAAHPPVAETKRK